LSFAGWIPVWQAACIRFVLLAALIIWLYHKDSSTKLLEQLEQLDELAERQLRRRAAQPQTVAALSQPTRTARCSTCVFMPTIALARGVNARCANTERV